MFQVWEKYMQGLAKYEKNGGQGAFIGGVPRFVVAGVSASQFALMKSVHKYVYTDINAAYTDCVTKQGDAIILGPGSHTMTATIAASKDQVSIMGFETWFGVRPYKPQAILTPAAASDGFTITGQNMVFAGISCVPITAKNFATFNGANGLIVQDCFVDQVTPAVNIATVGFKQAGATSNMRFLRNVSKSGGAQGEFLNLVGCTDVVMEDSHFFVTAGTWAAAVKTGAGTLAVRAIRNWFGGAGTALTGFVGTAAEATNAIELLDNRVGVGHTLASGYGMANGKCVLCENRIATVSGGTGSTLITVST